MIRVYETVLYKVVSVLEIKANCISSKVKNQILPILFAMITICALFYSCTSVSVHLLIKCVIGSIILVLIIFFSIDGKLRKPVWDKKIVGLWMIFGCIRMLSGFVTSIEYLPLACVWLILFPMLFIVWSSRGDYDTLLISLYRGFVYPVMGFIIASLIIVPITSEAFGGLAGNANAVGQYICAVLPLILYKYNLITTSKKEKFVLLIFMAVMISTVFYTRSRTTTLAAVTVGLVWLVWQKFFNSAEWKKILTIVAAISILSCGFTYGMLQINSTMHTSQKQQEAKIDDVVEGYVERIEGKDKHAGGAENYSSGRIGIWKKVIESVNVFGHPSREHIVTDRNGDVGANAHNNFLQFTYDQGIFGGVLFFGLCAVAFLKTICGVYQKIKYYNFILYNSVVFLLMSLVTSLNLPFLYIMSFSYYTGYAILFNQKK